LSWACWLHYTILTVFLIGRALSLGLLIVLGCVSHD
jgi:hypothetical protein